MQRAAELPGVEIALVCDVDSRPPDVRADQVRFYHLTPEFKVLSRHEIGVWH